MFFNVFIHADKYIYIFYLHVSVTFVHAVCLAVIDFHMLFIHAVPRYSLIDDHSINSLNVLTFIHFLLRAQQKHHPRKKIRHRTREYTRRPQLSMSKWTACLWHGPACPPRNATTRAQALFRACCHAPTCFVTYAGAPVFGQVQAHRPRPLEKILNKSSSSFNASFCD